MNIIPARTPALYNIDSSLLSKMVKAGYVEKTNEGYKWISDTPTIDDVAKIKEIYKNDYKQKTNRIKETPTIQRYYECLIWLNFKGVFHLKEEFMKFNLSEQIGTVLQKLGFIQKNGNNFE